MVSLSKPEKLFSPFNVKDELQHLHVFEIREWQQQHTIPYSIAMYNTVRDFNLASVVRNICAFGLETLYIVGYRKWDKRGAVGAYNYIDIQYMRDFDELCSVVGVENLVGMELPEHYETLSHDFVELSKFSWRSGQCLLIGEEGCGIPFEHLRQIRSKVYVDQPGAMRSLNAATASGIAMFHITTTAPQKAKGLSHGNV